MNKKMHANEFEIDISLAQQLLAKQFPCWADLPLKPVASSGTDNVLYRLGNDMVVRLPRIDWAVDNVSKEYEWLPRLASFLPISIPVPLALGIPSEEYPWPWSVYRWIKGSNPVTASDLLIHDLVEFIHALHKIDLSNGPISRRGVPLLGQDFETRQVLQKIENGDILTKIWEESLLAPEWSGPPVWVHGDLMPGNILVKNDRLSAVIDFGISGVGDPACDLIVAWNFIPTNLRAAFRRELKVDDATWLRGRGWALSTALIALPYYKDTNPVLANISRHVIQEIIKDF